MVYGSVQPQVKEALAEVRKLYEEKLLDDSFMLRTICLLYTSAVTNYLIDLAANPKFTNQANEEAGKAINLFTEGKLRCV